MDRELIINDFVELLEAQENDDERLKVLDEVWKTICRHCGCKLEYMHPCHCTNDE